MWKVNNVEAKHKTEGAINRIQDDEIILCLDAQPYTRKDISQSYKSNRDIPDPELVGTMRATIESLRDKGYKTARCQGWEADDVIATIVTDNTEDSITVYGTDKDLLQLCSLTDIFTGEVSDSITRLEVEKEQVVDYLSICGDTSDNVKGIDGIGPKTAVKMLSRYKTLDNMLDAVKKSPSEFKDKTAEKIMDSLDWIYQSRELITLRKDLEIEYEKREPKRDEIIDAEFSEPGEPVDAPVESAKKIQKAEPQTSHIVKHTDVDYRHSIEPVGVDGAWKASCFLFKSGLYQKYKGEEQVMAVIMRGRALGMDATTALDQMNLIQGRPTLSSQAIVGIIKASPVCRYFFLSESTPDTCTWETLRIGDPAPTKRTMTRKEADDAGFSSQPEYVWENGRKRKTGKIIIKDKWREMPATLLMWRCSTALGRPVYPDLINGIYSKEEME